MFVSSPQTTSHTHTTLGDRSSHSLSQITSPAPGFPGGYTPNPSPTPYTLPAPASASNQAFAKHDSGQSFHREDHLRSLSQLWAGDAGARGEAGAEGAAAGVAGEEAASTMATTSAPKMERAVPWAAPSTSRT